MEKFTCGFDLSNINDSMELESGIEIARLENDKYAVTLEVRGEVRVVFDDEVYKSVSQMPDELVQLFHDGKAYDDERVYVDMNNWFEVFFWEKKGKKLVWTNWSDEDDFGGFSVKAIEAVLRHYMKDYIDEWEQFNND